MDVRPRRARALDPLRVRTATLKKLPGACRRDVQARLILDVNWLLYVLHDADDFDGTVGFPCDVGELLPMGSCVGKTLSQSPGDDGHVGWCLGFVEVTARGSLAPMADEVVGTDVALGIMCSPSWASRSNQVVSPQPFMGRFVGNTDGFHARRPENLLSTSVLAR